MSKIVHNSSSPVSEEGNSDLSSTVKNGQISPALSWHFVVNNWTQLEYEKIVQYLSCHTDDFDYIVGKENEDKTPHLQGYVRSKQLDKNGKPRKIRLTWLRAICMRDGKVCHREFRAKGSEIDNYWYCSKDGDFVTNMKKPRQLTFPWADNMKQWQKDILRIIKKDGDDRTIYWYWSNNGNVGKTQFCKYLTSKFGAICVSGKSSDAKHSVVQYIETNKKAPDIVLFPIPRSFNTEYLNFQSIEEIKDMYFFSGKYEGSMVCDVPPHVFIFANEPPDESKMSSDRWVVENVDDPIHFTGELKKDRLKSILKKPKTVNDEFISCNFD